MIRISHGPGLPEISPSRGLPMLSEMADVEENPDARLWLEGEGEAIAHLALWWRDTPIHEGEHLGAIGGFAARDSDAARQLLEAACTTLLGSGCKMAVGPMNGNTWRRHRYIVESDGRGPFLLEPRNTGACPQWWKGAGFQELSRYSSSAMPLDGSRGVSGKLLSRLERSGIRIRGISTENFEADLRAIHAVSLKSFAENFLYTPLEAESFIAAYTKVRDQVRPEFVRIAERGGVPCGFVFGIPDLEAAARGDKPALIVKTLAVDPNSRCAGLGSVLVELLHEAGRKAGFTEAVHALQFESNSSLKITGRHGGEVFRRYALYFKPLL